MSTELQPSAWLEAARAQSARLVESRAHVMRPAPRLANRGFALRPLMTAAAFGLVGLVVSGAWALVVHRGEKRSAVHEVIAAPAVVPIAAAPAVAAPAIVEAPVVPAKRMKAHLRRPIALEKPVTPVVVVEPDEPFGDVIFGKPLVKQPPLFTTEEYKSRGILKP